MYSNEYLDIFLNDTCLLFLKPFYIYFLSSSLILSQDIDFSPKYIITKYLRYNSDYHAPDPR